jgi:hypothetical protein
MMALKKLTLSVDEQVVERARRYSEAHNTSISRLVTEFLARLPRQETRVAAAVARIRGILPAETDLEEYRRHLEKKHEL